MLANYDSMSDQYDEVWRGDEHRSRWYTTFSVVFKDHDSVLWLGYGAYDNAETCEGSADDTNSEEQTWVRCKQVTQSVTTYEPVPA